MPHSILTHHDTKAYTPSHEDKFGIIIIIFEVELLWLRRLHLLWPRLVMVAVVSRCHVELEFQLIKAMLRHQDQVQGKKAYGVRPINA